MMAWVHASVGAAIGRFTGNVPIAFGLGVVSHMICDLLPHKDLTPREEAPLLGAALVTIAARNGVLSPEMAGAIGAFSPDVENAASMFGIIPAESMRFPTHRGEHSHGPKMRSVGTQVVLAGICLAFALAPRRPR